MYVSEKREVTVKKKNNFMYLLGVSLSMSLKMKLLREQYFLLKQ